MTSTHNRKPSTKPAHSTLTDAERGAMRLVQRGADVWSYTTAKLLRDVERKHPSYINIGKAMNAPEDGAMQQPYFGAILTKQGKQALKAEAHHA